MNDLNMRNKLDATIDNGMFAIVRRCGKLHAIKLTGYDTEECYSLVQNEISPTGSSWVESEGLYTWALWYAEFIEYRESLY